MRAERCKFSTFFTVLALAIWAEPTYAQLKPPVYLLSDSNAPKVARDAALKGLSDVGNPSIASIAEYGEKIKQTEAKVATLVAKLVDESDGSEPIFVAITDNRWVGGSFWKTENGVRVLTMNVGTLAIVDDDSQLALAIGHELKVGSSQIKEVLESRQKRGYFVRPSILDGLAQEGVGKTVENEADVKSLVEKVHKKGYSPTSAVKFFDNVMNRYGDGSGFSKSKLVQRISVLNAAMTGFTRGKGEELRTAPVNDIVDKEWKAYFKSADYRRPASKVVQAALRSQSFPAAETVLNEIKNGAIGSGQSPRASNLISGEVERRLGQMNSAISDRSLLERLKIEEALNHQVVKDYLTLKERILGKSFSARTVDEAIHLLALSSTNSWHPSIGSNGGSSPRNLEEAMSLIYQDIVDARNDIDELKKAPDAKTPKVLEQIADGEAEMARKEALLLQYSKLYKISPEQVRTHLVKSYKYDNESRSAHLLEVEQAKLRSYRKMYDKIRPQIEADQMRAVRDFEKFIANLVDANGESARLLRFNGFQNFPGSKVELRRVMLVEYPRLSLERASGAADELRMKIARDLDRSWFNEIVGSSSSPTEVLDAFKTAESSKVLKEAVELINEARLAEGRTAYRFVTDPRVSGIVEHQNQIYVPADKLGLFTDTSAGPLKSAEKSLIVQIRNAKQLKSVGDAFQSFMETSRDDILQQHDSVWLNEIRDAMAERYRQLQPSLSQTRELAEAVIDLKMSWGDWPTYGIGSKEVMRRLESAATTLAAVPVTLRPNQISRGFELVDYSDLFRYRVWQMPQGSTGDVELFQFLSKNREVLSEFGEIIEEPKVYSRHVLLRRNYALWTAENDPKNISVAREVSSGVFKHVDGKRIAPTDVDTAKLKAAMVAKFRKNGQVDWPTYFKYDSDVSFSSPDFWRGLSQGQGEVWVDDLLGIQKAILDAHLQAKPTLKRKDQNINGKYEIKRMAGFIDSDFVKEAAPTATPEQLQELLKRAFATEKAWPARDQLFEVFWKATEKRPDLRAAFTDEKLVGRLMFKENGLLLAKHQIATRFPDVARGLGVRDSNLVTGEMGKIVRAIETQFPEASFTRNALLDWTEKKLNSTPAEHRALARLWVNQDNWVELKGLALSDTLDTLVSALETNSERFAVIDFILGRTDKFPEEILKRRAIRMMDPEGTFAERFKMIPSRFATLDPYERAFSLHPFLVGEDGVLATPEGRQKLETMILGSHADDVRFKAFFASYMQSVKPHETSTLMSYLLGQNSRGGDSPGKVMRQILEAMPPLGIRSGQEVRSSGLASAEINLELDQLRDQAMPPSRDQIHRDVAKAFKGNEKNVRVGPLRGSGSINYVVDIDVYDPVKKIWQPRVLKVQRENVAGQVTAENGNWTRALTSLKDHSDRDVRVAADILDESRANAIRRLQPGGAELSAKAEARLHSAAAVAYDGSSTRAVRPDADVALLIPKEHIDKFGVYERIDGVPLNQVKNAAERKRFATTILDREFAAIFSGNFDSDPQLGNWLREQSTGHFVRLDYAQMTTADKNELESFRKLIVTMVDPKTSAKDAKNLVGLWSGVMTPAADAEKLESELRSILDSSGYKSAKGPWERLTLLRYEMNQRLLKAGLLKQEFRGGIGAAWTSIKKLSGIRGEYLSDAEFFKVVNRQLRLPITTQVRLARESGMTTKQIAASAVSKAKTAVQSVFSECITGFRQFGSKVPAH